MGAVVIAFEQRVLRALGLALVLGVSACGETPAPGVTSPTLTRKELMDPETCSGCHADHYQQWSASMHAYAAKDPVFLAMNRRGQEETKGELGTFCVNCHAPMAVVEGLTDGTNVEELPEAMQGVTCYFCHNAKAVEGTHNNPIVLDDDNPLTMRAGISDPLRTSAHDSEASDLLTSAKGVSANLCGACHDIVLPSPPGPAPVHGEPIALERTFQEWKTTIFAAGKNPKNPDGVTCGGCHLPPPPGKPEGEAALGSGRTRQLHDHLMPGVDVSLHPVPLPDVNAQRAQDLLDTSLRVARLCVEYPKAVEERDRIRLLVDIDNVSAGHSFPSGASQDRRAWVDVRVLVDEKLVYSSGASEVGSDVLALEDPDLMLFRDITKKADGSPAHMFWDVAELTVGTIPGPTTTVIGAPGYDDTHAVRYFPRAIEQWIDAPYDPERLRVELRIRMQPIGYDVLDDLVASGHLSEAFRHRVRDTTLLLNKNLARAELIAKEPGFARFSELSFEWSALTLNSAFFAMAAKIPRGASELYCAGMNRP